MLKIVPSRSVCQVFVSTCAAILAVICVPGCESAAPTSRSDSLTCKVPVITPQAETLESQDKGGVAISIAPVSYSMAVQPHVIVVECPGPLLAVGKQGQVHVRRTTNFTAAVEPDHLRFMLKVNNKMPRVFRGAGTVVQFNVGGRLQAVDQSAYQQILGAIIPPRQEQQIEIVGPALSSLTSDKGTIGVFLYDVVTNQNEAGVVIEKQNFEWYFDYTLQPQEQTVQSNSEERWMSISEYEQEMNRQNVERANRQQPFDPRYRGAPR